MTPKQIRTPYEATPIMVVRKAFDYLGTRYQPGDPATGIFPWQALGVDERKLRQMYDHGRIDPARTPEELALAKAIAEKLRIRPSTVSATTRARVDARVTAASEAVVAARLGRTVPSIPPKAPAVETGGTEEATDEAPPAPPALTAEEAAAANADLAPITPPPNLPVDGLTLAEVVAVGGGWYNVTLPGETEPTKVQGARGVREHLASLNAYHPSFADDFEAKPGADADAPEDPAALARAASLMTTGPGEGASLTPAVRESVR